uniref:hypothetical protein n=1 Tax=Petrachloros mirabilis TaxID=2918835 RepID=UPI0030846B77
MVITLNKPSSPIHEIQLEKVGNWNLFKFSESLQLRMETLLERKKADQLTPDEMAEFDAIGELDRIFTHINAAALTLLIFGRSILTGNRANPSPTTGKTIGRAKIALSKPSAMQATPTPLPANTPPASKSSIPSAATPPLP